MPPHSADAPAAGLQRGPPELRQPRPLSAPVSASDDLIDRYIDHLWLEDGLAANTLAAYRRDLTAFADWLAGQQGRGLDEAQAADVL